MIMRMVTILMHLAPYGVFCLLAKLFTEENAPAIVTWRSTLTVTWCAGACQYGLHQYFQPVYPPQPHDPDQEPAPAMLFAFSTSSSNATMPVTMNVMEKRVGVDNSVASFTVPLGATINMDGTAIMQGVATVFIQAYGLDLGLTEYLAVIATATWPPSALPGCGVADYAVDGAAAGGPAGGRYRADYRCR